MEAETRPGGRRMTLWEVVRRILTYLRPYRLLVSGVFFYIFVSIALDLTGPKLLGAALDTLRLAMGGAAGGEAARGGPRSPPAQAFTTLLYFVGAYLGVGLLAQVFNFRKELLRTRLSTSVLCDIRVQLYTAIQALCFRFHDRNRSGELIARTTRDIYRIHSFYTETIFLGAEFLLVAGGAAVLIALCDLRLALLAFSTFPFATLVIVRTAVRLRDMSREVGDRYDEVTQVLQESIAGVRVVKAFAKENRQIDKFEDRMGTFLERVIHAADYFTLNVPLAGALFNLSIPITLGGGGLLAVRGSLGVGDLAATLFYLTKIGTLMRVLNRIVQTTEEAAASADRVFDILDARPHVKEAAKPLRMPAGGRGRVEFQGVEFAYRGDLAVLRGVDLTVEPGETLGIVGPTGSGKTSLVALLPRFYEATAGRILLDGVDVRDLSLEDLRQAVSVIFQDTFLFSATIAQNIAYGRPGTSREEIERSARAAQIHDFIVSLEDGYDTVVGERGINLSGGQKQRLAIARAFLMNPRVLILDDCTASVDAQTERRLKTAMAAIARGRTTLIIAQRLSSVIDADRIVLLDQGRVSARGTHHELLSMSQLYGELYRQQMVWTAAAPAATAS